MSNKNKQCQNQIVTLLLKKNYIVTLHSNKMVNKMVNHIVGVVNNIVHIVNNMQCKQYCLQLYIVNKKIDYIVYNIHTKNKYIVYKNKTRLPL